ncbi:isoprenoid synthase domain-containing protein [Mycena sanguinolenta]|nr:isoprenoid synthase domain-containing protein [Mycena sanguinolenta]
MSFYDDTLSKLSTPAPWSAINESAVLEPFSYLTSNPGKDILDRLIGAFNVWMDVPADTCATISKIVNMLHTASLIVDDIEDNSHLRRGKPVAHRVFGIPQTINAANYVYFIAQREILSLSENSRLSDKQLIAMFTEEMISSHRGQGLELVWRESLQCPTEEEYIHMVNDKTSGGLRITLRFLMACATRNIDVDYIPLVNLIGILYQMRDDLLNLQSCAYSSEKGFAEDLTEGKFSFPIVHGILANPADTRILEVLKQRPTTEALKAPVVEYLKTETRSFEYTLSVLAKLESQVRTEVARLGGNERLERIIDALHVDSATLGS